MNEGLPSSYLPSYPYLSATSTSCVCLVDPSIPRWQRDPIIINLNNTAESIKNGLSLLLNDLDLNNNTTIPKDQHHGSSPEPSTSFIINVQTPPNRTEWSAKEKRIYQRINSLLTFWFYHKYKILWVMLSSSQDSNYKEMSPHLATLKKRIAREYGFKCVEHFASKTEEGFGVYHLLFAYKEKDGERRRRFYIPQEWLSTNWNEIHGGSYCWIKQVQPSKLSQRKLSNYCVQHYAEGVDRISWSWKHGLGGALAKTWEALKKILPKKDRITIWNKLLGGREYIKRKETQFKTEIWKFTPPPSLGFVYSVHYADGISMDQILGLE